MEIKRTAELVGLLAVVLSLIFLGYELKRANDIAEAEAISSIMGEVNGFVAMYSADEAMYRAWTQGLRDFDSMNAADKLRFRRLLNYAFNGFEIMIIYYRNGLVDDDYAEYFARDLCGLINANDGTRKVWASMKDERVVGLVEFVDDNCGTGD